MHVTKRRTGHAAPDIATASSQSRWHSITTLHTVQSLRLRAPITVLACVGVLCVSLLGMNSQLNAQEAPEVPELEEDVPDGEDPPVPLAALKHVPIPGPSDTELAALIQDKRAAIQLGKALFWDTRVGSDNKTACATCHFHAGADNRVKNQLSAGLLAGDKTFQVGGPNHTLTMADFPFTRYLAPPEDTADKRVRDANDVASSQGVSTRVYTEVSAQTATETCSEVADVVLHGGTGFVVDKVNTRRVAPRNTPSAINAVYNFRNFWDGRANNIFNGVDPFGLRNPNAYVYKYTSRGVSMVPVALPSSSLASQASGPPLSSNEMSCSGRQFSRLGRKLLSTPILVDQRIAPDDSVLGTLATSRPTYGDLVKQAFRPEYWNAPILVNIPVSPTIQTKSMDITGSFPAALPIRPAALERIPQMEANFALYFGIALQMYESTLISDDSPLDRHLDGKANALTVQQLRGLALFQGQAKCINCHGGAELTNASFANVISKRLETMPINGQSKTYDNGFYNIGVRPTAEDLGVGAMDPFNNPLSEARMAALGKTNMLGNAFDSSTLPPLSSATISVDGAFKTPGLRNVELTGPYFHNGGKATLMQVIDFYNRGGDFAKENRQDLHPDIKPLGLSQQQKEDLVAFLLALTDERVRYKKAPFDHPSLCIPNGHYGDTKLVLPERSGKAADLMTCLSETGAKGSANALVPFLNASPFQR